MNIIPVVDHELVIHVFTPTDGPHAAAAYDELQGLWLRCRSLLGMVDVVPGLALPNHLPPALSDLPRAPELALAAQERADAPMQAIVRLHHDVLNLSVVLSSGVASPLGDEDLAGFPNADWPSLDQMWRRVAGHWSGALLGTARIYQAKLTSANPVWPDPGLGQQIRPLLPPAAEQEGWWHDGLAVPGGFTLWECSPRLDARPERRLVVIAPADRDPQVSAWTWSRGDVGIPPLARYLLHAAKIRYGLRVWTTANDRGVPHGVAAALHQTVEQISLRDQAVRAAGHPEDLTALTSHEIEAGKAASGLRRLRRSVEIALANMRQTLGPDADALFSGTGPLADDLDLGKWLVTRLDDELFYLEDAATQARHVASLLNQSTLRPSRARDLDAAVELPKTGLTTGGACTVTGDGDTGAADADRLLGDHVKAEASSSTPPHPPEVPVPDARSVFVIHGRDAAALKAFRGFLQALDLRPLDWEQVVARTGNAAPTLIDVLDKAIEDIQAAVVLLTPDDVGTLHPNLYGSNEPEYETKPTGQARPNVLFEAGMALARYRTRTVIIEIGELRPFSDLGGVNVIKFDGTVEQLHKIAHRLRVAGCAVDTTGPDWLDTHRFNGLDAYTRRP
ncbi:CATRA conflict system CASPASE/TPR repeat-associated protein [Micromonospora zamorensis]|uniref:CATRA conflict system CASPASE/TPR repeat-associated protein n=1 Tax=Micromonospora zamorensis TaxID=709883 RepID=UPI0033BFBC91